MAKELTERLARSFHFSRTDLTANSQGLITERQLGFLKLRRRMHWAGFCTFAAAMTLTTAFFYWMEKNESSGPVPIQASSVSSVQTLTPTTIVLFLCAAIVLIYTPFFIRRLSSLYPAAPVTITGGAMMRHRSHQLAVTILDGHSAGKGFRSASAVTFMFPDAEPYLSAFTPNKEYVVYFLPGPNPTLLSGRFAGDDQSDSIGGEGEHPAADLARVVPLILVLLLAASFGIPIVLIYFGKILGAVGYSHESAFWPSLIVGLGLVSIYLSLIRGLLRSGGRKINKN